MESPKRKGSFHFENPEEIIEELPQEDFEGSPSIETKVKATRNLPVASTSESTNSSRSQSLTRSQDPPNIVYPSIVTNTLTHGHGHGGSIARRGSLQILQMMDPVNPVQEEEAEERDGETRTIKLKQIKDFVDLDEFSTSEQRRSRNMDKSQYRPRARSFERPSAPLEKVQEAKNEEEKLANTHLLERKWMELIDNDEFNTKDRSKNKSSVEAEKLIAEQKAVLDKKPRSYSFNLDDGPILEEAARENRGRISSHLHQIHMTSPKIDKLMVDEIDLERKKSEFEQYQTEIDEEPLLILQDVIKEDAQEYGETQQAEEILEKAKQKMTGEKEFIKKFVRNETEHEIDSIRITLERELSSQSKNERCVIKEEDFEDFELEKDSWY